MSKLLILNLQLGRAWAIVTFVTTELKSTFLLDREGNANNVYNALDMTEFVKVTGQDWSKCCLSKS